MASLEGFINNIGLLCEEWTIVYRSFLSQGLNPKEALMHTQAFMSAVFAEFKKEK